MHLFQTYLHNSLTVLLNFKLKDHTAHGVAHFFGPF